MSATDIFYFLVTTLKRQKEACEMNSDHIFNPKYSTYFPYFFALFT